MKTDQRGTKRNRAREEPNPMTTERKMYEALRRIAKDYQTPTQLRRTCERDYGLDYEDALEMAYENIRNEAKRAIKGMKSGSVGASGAG